MPFPPNGPDLPSIRGSLPLRGVTVLAVEDSRFSSDALRLVLTRAGARLKRAETLAKARAHLSRYQPDLAIVDLGLPDGRGEDLIAEAASQGMPVLAISGDPDSRVPALEAGAVAFVEKPMPSVAGFLRIIRQLVTGHGAVGPEVDQPAPAADPMALRDDLAHAAFLAGEPAADTIYLAGFVRSLARESGDRALEEAALHALSGSSRGALSHLLAARLTGQGTVA